jgi:DNA-binding CsgD family transcriptional regulator
LAAARSHLAHAHGIADLADQWRGLSGQLALADGVVALGEGMPELAKLHFVRATAIFRRFEYPWAEAEVQLAWGRGLNALAEHGSAAQHLDAAAEIYRRRGASSVSLDRLNAAQPPREATLAPANLSEREMEVLRLLAVGRSNRQIAEGLVISLNTVASHVSHVFAKIGAANRAEATSYAHRHGIV